MVQQPSHKVKLVQLLPIGTILRQSSGGGGAGDGGGGGEGGEGGSGGEGNVLQWAGMLL
jgi:preprotein translocase subunit SecG